MNMYVDNQNETKDLCALKYFKATFRIETKIE